MSGDCEACGKPADRLTTDSPHICEDCFNLIHLHWNQGETADQEWVDREFEKQCS